MGSIFGGGGPSLPSQSSLTELRESEEEKAAREAAARQADLEKKIQESGRPSTIQTSPLGIAGLGGQQTILSALLGRQ